MKRLIDTFDRHASKIKNVVLPAMGATFLFNAIAQPNLPFMSVSLGAGVLASFVSAVALRPNAPNVPFDLETIGVSSVVTMGGLYSAHLMSSLIQ